MRRESRMKSASSMRVILSLHSRGQYLYTRRAPNQHSRATPTTQKQLNARSGHQSALRFRLARLISLHTHHAASKKPSGHPSATATSNTGNLQPCADVRCASPRHCHRARLTALPRSPYSPHEPSSCENGTVLASFTFPSEPRMRNMTDGSIFRSPSYVYSSDPPNDAAGDKFAGDDSPSPASLGES